MEPEVNVIDIIKEIREDIAARGYSDDVASFNITASSEQEDAEFELYSLETNLADYGATCIINTHPVITSSGGLFGRVIVFVKRLIRKCINFHITPIVWDVNQSNHKSLEMFRQLRNASKFHTEFDERLARIELELKRTNQRIVEENERLKNLLDMNGEKIL